MHTSAAIRLGMLIPVLVVALVGCLPACAAPRTNAGPPTARATLAQCDRPGVAGANVVARTRFNVGLPSFGDVCFLARRHPADPAQHETDLIGFELWHDGALAYTLPTPPRYLWNDLCDKIRAVAFSHHGDQADIIVLGICTTAGSDELSQPLIFSSQPGGFRFDGDLSEASMGLDTIKQVQGKIRALRQGAH